jgi:hypothetical protein
VELWDFYNLVGFEVFFLLVGCLYFFAICLQFATLGSFMVHLVNAKEFKAKKKDLMLFQYFQYSCNIDDRNPLMIFAPLEKEECCYGAIIATLCLW